MATSITNDNLENLKVPPHSIEAEQSVLGGLMLQNEVWYETVELVSSAIDRFSMREIGAIN